MNEIMDNFSTLTDFIPLALIIICVNFATNFEVEKKNVGIKTYKSSCRSVLFPLLSLTRTMQKL